MNISIVITAYNKDSLLVDAVNSALSLIGDDDEVVVVDDCSTNAESINCIKALTKKYKKNNNISFYATDTNLGAAGAKNYGVGLSKGDVIVLLDADDELIVDSLDTIRFAFAAEDVSFVFGNYIKKILDTEYSEVIDCSKISVNGYLHPNKAADNWILLGSSPFRKSVFQYLGGYDATHPKTDDVDLQRKAIVAGYKFKYINSTIYKWKITGDGNNSLHALHVSAFSFFRNIEFFYKYSRLSKFLLLFIKQVIKLIVIKMKK